MHHHHAGLDHNADSFPHPGYPGPCVPYGSWPGRACPGLMQCRAVLPVQHCTQQRQRRYHRTAHPLWNSVSTGGKMRTAACQPCMQTEPLVAACCLSFRSCCSTNSDTAKNNITYTFTSTTFNGCSRDRPSFYPPAPEPTLPTLPFTPTGLALS